MKSFAEIRGTHKEELVEGTNQPADPPVMLVMRRKAIRNFSGGERVALYGNERLGIEVSIPYKAGHYGRAVTQAVHEEELDEGAIHKLYHIAKSKTSQDVMFKNGAMARIDPQTARRIVGLHGQMNRGNKIEMAKMINSGSAGITKVAKFAIDNHMFN